MRLYEKLENLKSEGSYPYHMPGHKRNVKGFLEDAYSIDITEITGFDNLHKADGIIKEAEENAAEIYGSRETHFLVNGSTSGILAAIFSATDYGDEIIVLRNTHKAVANACFLNNLSVHYVYPEKIYFPDNNEGWIYGSVSPESILSAIKEFPKSKAVLLTSPTYDGVISDIKSISEICHSNSLPLIVDEAHGAHLFLEGKSAVENLADIVINSVHKTLPAFTQTALIHLNSSLISSEKLKKYLGIFQTSSPSYILMGSIDYAMHIVEEQGDELNKDHKLRLKEIYGLNEKLKFVTVYKPDGVYGFDEGKLLIKVKGRRLGNYLFGILSEKYKLEPEMKAADYVLLMTSFMDSNEGFEKLMAALSEIDEMLSEGLCETETKKEEYPLIKAGDIASKSYFAYPPGIPLIVEGETVTEEMVKEMCELCDLGICVN